MHCFPNTLRECLNKLVRGVTTEDTFVVRVRFLKVVSFGTNGMKFNMLILYLTSLSVAHSV
jgi:hypothetical protein